MRWVPAEKNGSCAECLQISRELGEAYAEAYARKQVAADALRRLIGGTEKDAECADELLSAYRYRPLLAAPFVNSYQYQAGPGLRQVPAVLRAAMQRAAQHVARTGHFLRPAAR
jgi:hypothetical protein